MRYKIPTDGFPSLGPANAPITLVEFGDFQCPYCRQWEQQTYQPLLAAYPGKIRFVFRDFPLTSIHPNAMPAAEAAQCANEQGKFWPYHDKLFGSETLSDDVYKQYAQDLGLDVTRFNACVSSHKYLPRPSRPTATSPSTWALLSRPPSSSTGWQWSERNRSMLSQA